MNPQKKEEKQEVNYNPNNQPKENFTNEQFLRVWKEFTLKVKRDKKDSLFSTLVNGEPKFDSNLNIKITVSSSVAAKEVDAIKPEMLKFIRTKLNNFDINLTYDIIKSAKTEFQDSKTKFKKMSSENPSLEKLRKLFNLDIEY